MTEHEDGSLAPDAESLGRLDVVRAQVLSTGGMLVCFSGGLDSGFLCAVARETLGDRAVAYTAVSASHPAWDLEAGKRAAAALGIRHVTRETNEIEDPRYASNPKDRCYYCKMEVFGTAWTVARELGLAAVADGTTSDDMSDWRPGRTAAGELAVLSPLASAGLTKEQVRILARDVYHLPFWARPASPCLASRFPYGTAIDVKRLKQVETIESALRDLGYAEFRARFHGDMVRIEVRSADLPRLAMDPDREAVVKAAHAAGFAYVTVDLEPFRSGRLNG